MFCGKVQCPNCKVSGYCEFTTCVHPEIENSKTLYFPAMIGSKYFQSWDELEYYITYGVKN